MNVLILGGNGYIGSKITRQLVNEGYQVVCTKRPFSDTARLNDISDDIKWIPASIDAVESALQYMKFDYVLNMVCNYGRGNALYHDVIEANIVFPLKVLASAVDHGTKKFLTIGTGLPDNLNMYSFSKKKFNEFGNFFVEKHGITFNSLALEMFYGADEPQNRFLPSIIQKMINGEDVDTTFGKQHLDIIAAEDVVKAIRLIMDSDCVGFNEIPIGTGESPSISEIIDFIWDETGRKSKVNKGAIPMRDNEPDCVADTSVISSITEWKPIHWKSGLRKMIKDMEGIER